MTSLLLRTVSRVHCSAILSIHLCKCSTTNIFWLKNKYFQFVGTFSVDVDVLARKSQTIQSNLNILRVRTI